MVSYDIHNADHVWARTLDGRFICEARWDGHKTSYFPVPVAEQARQRRVEGKKRRLAAHLDTAEAELRQPLLEHQPAIPMPPIAAEPAAITIDHEPATVPAAAQQRVSASGRPLFTSDAEWALWLATHSDQVTIEDRDHLRALLRSGSFRQLLEWEGADLVALDDIAKPKTEAA